MSGNGGVIAVPYGANDPEESGFGMRRSDDEEEARTGGMTKIFKGCNWDIQQTSKRKSEV